MRPLLKMPGNRGNRAGTEFAGCAGMHPKHEAHTAPEPTEEWPTLDVLRLRYIHRAIEHTNNNKTRAAELLGIDRRTLNRILARERARRRSNSAEATH